MEYKTDYLSIVLMGKIASGKGTQTQMVLKDFGGSYFANGDNIRAAGKKDSVFGKKMKAVYEEGFLMPEWIASYWMARAILDEHPDDIIVFESVAKKPDEADLFHEIHEWMGRSYIVFNLVVSDDLVHERSEARARDVNDTSELISKRLDEYRTFTEKSIDIFRSHGKVVDIDGDQTPEQVREEIFKHLQKHDT